MTDLEYNATAEEPYTIKILDCKILDKGFATGFPSTDLEYNATTEEPYTINILVSKILDKGFVTEPTEDM